MDEDAVVRAARARKGSPFLTPDQAAYYLGLKVKTLYNLRWQGRGPHFRKHSRFIRYHIDDLEAWSREKAPQPGARGLPNA